MQLANKIKQLRIKRGLTQDELASRLGVTPQAVSKWENGVTAPDISLLPEISEIFGVTIDELFDLSVAQKMERIESKLDVEEELTNQEFDDIEAFLKAQVDEKANAPKAYYLLAYLHTHRLMSEAKKASKYGRQAILLDPSNRENTQWMINKAEAGSCWDWDISNHSGIIQFYKGVVEANPEVAEPYHHLLWNLIADHRAEEAEFYLGKLRKLRPDQFILHEFYRAAIALARFDEKEANEIVDSLAKEHGEDECFLFEMAQYLTKKGQFDKAIELYEGSFAKDERRPRYSDALLGIIDIYGIEGDVDKQIETYDRLLTLYKEEWKMRDDEATVLEALEKRNKLIDSKK